jgi:hypothetical protein
MADLTGTAVAKLFKNLQGAVQIRNDRVTVAEMLDLDAQNSPMDEGETKEGCFTVCYFCGFV